MMEHIWETFDAIYKSVYRQGRRVDELEQRVETLERQLRERQESKPLLELVCDASDKDGALAPRADRTPPSVTDSA